MIIEVRPTKLRNNEIDSQKVVENLCINITTNDSVIVITTMIIAKQ